MNNLKWIHRITKGDFYSFGPYGYLLRKAYINDGYTEESIKELKDVLYKKERWYGHVYQDCINDVLRKYKAFDESGCFSTFTHRRPGPWDDPVLKHNLRIRFGKNARLEMTKKKFRWWGFGFDSKEQMSDWFNDHYENEILEKFGFTKKSRKVETKHVIFGLRQCWVLID